MFKLAGSRGEVNLLFHYLRNTVKCTTKPRWKRDGAFDPHEGYMQVLYTKHELEYCHLACEGEIGSERTKSARLVEQTRQPPRRKHPAGVTLLAWGNKPPSRLCRHGRRVNGRNRRVWLNRRAKGVPVRAVVGTRHPLPLVRKLHAEV